MKTTPIFIFRSFPFSTYIYIYIYMCVCVYIYIYISVEKGKERKMNICLVLMICLLFVRYYQGKRMFLMKKRNHHHHHVVLVARISLTLTRHFSLSFIASGRYSVISFFYEKHYYFALMMTSN